MRASSSADVGELASELETWAMVREKVLEKIDMRAARKAREALSTLKDAQSRLLKAIRAGNVTLIEEIQREIHGIRMGVVELMEHGGPAESGEHVTVAPQKPMLVVVDRPTPARAQLLDSLVDYAQILLAEDFSQALAFLEHSAVRLIVADDTRPGESGTALLHHVARVRSDVIRVLFAEKEPDDMEALFARSIVHAYVRKPEGYEEILWIVRQGLRAPPPPRKKTPW